MIRIRRGAHVTRWLLFWLAALITGMVAGLWGGAAAFALPFDPVGPQPIEKFTPPPNGFVWQMPSRFGTIKDNGTIDFHWTPDTYGGTFVGGPGFERLTVSNGYYDPGYVQPDHLVVDFDGCPSQSEENLSGSNATQNTYTWNMVSGSWSFASAAQHSCDFSYNFEYSQFGSALYDGLNVSVTLSAAIPGSDSVQYTQNVFVKDYLIVSIGDSFASGEGNPDIQGGWELFPEWIPPVWEDTRCHRSAASGPAQAALAIEQSDPHSSVTFLSFACSGATVETPEWEQPLLEAIGDLVSSAGLVIGPVGQAFGFDASEPDGEGVLAPYRGAEVPPGSIFDPNNGLLAYLDSTPNYVPAQIDQVMNAVGSRRIDALIISGGGNDIGFGYVAEACLLTRNCPSLAVVQLSPGPNYYSLSQAVSTSLGELPGKYHDLANAIAGLNIASNPTTGLPNIYITQYPDLERDDNGNYCQTMLDDVFGLLHVYASDVQWTGNSVFTPLNQAVQAAAEANNWHFVDHVADNFISDASGHGHGYCASDPWIRRAAVAAAIQGPPGVPGFGFPVAYTNNTTATKGTLHPNARGQQEVAARLLAAITPDLPRSGPTPTSTPTPPSFNTVAASSDGSITAQRGAHGWLIGSCNGGNCSSSSAVYQVTATGSTAINAQNVLINGVNSPASWVTNTSTGTSTSDCSAAGVSCAALLNGTQTQLNWNFTFRNDGVYNLRLAAEDANNETSSFQDEVKIDLHDPSALSQLSPTAPNPAGWYKVPVTVTLYGNDGPSGSGIDHLQYTLDGGSSTVAPPGAQLPINTDGIHSVGFQAFDAAGRQSTPQTVTVQLDQTPPSVSVSVNPSSLWPPNSQMVPVTISGAITDASSGVNPATVAYAVTDEYGSVQPSGHLSLGAGGSYTATLLLQASRNNTDLDGRQYTVAVSAQDNAGNNASSSTSVTVPHDQRS